MRSKAHRFRLQVAIIDEDNEGDSINEVWLELQEWIGQKNFKAGLAEYLESLEEFLIERNETLAALEAEPQEN